MILNTLIIEDEMILAVELESMLKDLGHQVVGIASRLDEAVEMATATDFDIAILDLNLAGEMSGPLADLLVELGKPFVISTGYGKDELDPRYVGRPVLSKPYDEQTLVHVLERVFEEVSSTSWPNREAR